MAPHPLYFHPLITFSTLLRENQTKNADLKKSVHFHNFGSNRKSLSTGLSIAIHPDTTFRWTFFFYILFPKKSEVHNYHMRKQPKEKEKKATHSKIEKFQ